MSQNKRIWIINHYAIPPSMGGLNRHYYFAQELEKRGHDVRIFTSSAIHNTDINMIEGNEKFKEINIDGQIYTYIKSAGYSGNGLSRIKNMLGFMFDVQKIKRRYGHEKPDVIYTSTPDLLTAFSAVILAKRMHVPVIVEVRDLWPLSIVEYKGMSNKNPIIMALYVLEKWLYKKATALIFTMPGGKDYIIDKKWTKTISLDKVFHINNGIDLSKQDYQRKNVVLQDADLDCEGFKVVYVGSIREANDLSKLLDVAKVIKSQYSDIKFIIYGDGSQKEELEQRCTEERIDNVVFKGRVDKKYVPGICARASINYINVKQTGVNQYGVSWNKLFDYMAAGKPIVSTVKVNYDLIEQTACGITCENQNVETIIDAILKIKNLKQEEYQKMCVNARKTAEQFDFKILTEKLEEVIAFIFEKR